MGQRVLGRPSRRVSPDCLTAGRPHLGNAHLGVGTPAGPRGRVGRRLHQRRATRPALLFCLHNSCTASDCIFVDGIFVDEHAEPYSSAANLRRPRRCGDRPGAPSRRPSRWHVPVKSCETRQIRCVVGHRRAAESLGGGWLPPESSEGLLSALRSGKISCRQLRGEAAWNVTFWLLWSYHYNLR
jgi:hypothetical protein